MSSPRRLLVLARVTAGLRAGLAALRGASANRDVRRLQLAFLGSAMGQWAGSVAITVYAYEAAGPAGVGLQIALRMIPGALFAPFGGVLADRFDRRRLMIGCDLARLVITLGIITLILAEAPYLLVLLGSAMNGIAGATFEPAKAALLPSLVREPEELTAANVVSSTIDSVAMLAGPALGGIVLALTSIPAALAVTAAAFVWSALLVAGISPDPRRETPGETGGIARQALAGLQVVARVPQVRLVIGLVTVQTFVAGALAVLLVAAALDLLDLGRGGLGALEAALGGGGVLGAVVAAALAGRRRLSGPLALGLLLWGLPLALIGLLPHVAAALVCLVAVGAGNTVLDVAAYTLLQRSAPEETLGRVFGILEALILGSIAVGGVAGAAMVELAGVQATYVATGLVLPVVLAATWPALRRLDAASPVPREELALLRGVPMLAPLRPTTLEALAAALEPVGVDAGDAVVTQGEPGERFFVIARGRVEVLVDGRRVREQGPGDWFGEIALLRDEPRTATVRALEPVELRALDREPFLAAVTGHAAGAQAAEAVVGARLGWARPAVAA